MKPVAELTDAEIEAELQAMMDFAHDKIDTGEGDATVTAAMTARAFDLVAEMRKRPGLRWRVDLANRKLQ